MAARRGSSSVPTEMDRSDDTEPGSHGASATVRPEDIRTAKISVEALQLKLNAATMSDDPNASANVAKELTLANRRLRQLEASYAEQERRREEVAKTKESIQVGIMNTKMTTEERRREMMELGTMIHRQMTSAGLTGDALTATGKKLKRLQLMIEQDVMNTDKVAVGADGLAEDEKMTFRAMRKDCVQALQGLEVWLDQLNKHMTALNEASIFLITPYAGHRTDPSLTAAMNAAAAAAAAAQHPNSHSAAAGGGGHAYGNGSAPAAALPPASMASPAPHARPATAGGNTPLQQTPTATRTGGSSSSSSSAHGGGHHASGTPAHGTHGHHAAHHGAGHHGNGAGHHHTPQSNHSRPHY